MDHAGFAHLEKKATVWPSVFSSEKAQALSPCNSSSVKTSFHNECGQVIIHRDYHGTQYTLLDICPMVALLSFKLKAILYEDVFQLLPMDAVQATQD